MSEWRSEVPWMALASVVIMVWAAAFYWLVTSDDVIRWASRSLSEATIGDVLIMILFASLLWPRRRCGRDRKP